MSRTFLSRTAPIAAATALLGGFAVAVVAAPTADAAPCTPSSSASKKVLLNTHTYSKSVTDTAGAGSKVTYKIDVGSDGAPIVNSITDIPPAGFGKPTAKVTAWHLIGGMKEEKVEVIGADGGWRVASTAWAVNSGHPVSASFTYTMPVSSIPGKAVTSGGIAVTGTVGVDNKLPDLTACFLTRPMTPGEAIGSVSSDLSSSGSTQDIISDVVGGVVEGAVSGSLSGAGS